MTIYTTLYYSQSLVIVMSYNPYMLIYIIYHTMIKPKGIFPSKITTKMKTRFQIHVLRIRCTLFTNSPPTHTFIYSKETTDPYLPVFTNMHCCVLWVKIP